MNFIKGLKNLRNCVKKNMGVKDIVHFYLDFTLNKAKEFTQLLIV